MNLRKNDVVTSEIIDITNLGFGVAKVDGIVIFVSDCVPGDVDFDESGLQSGFFPECLPAVFTV